MVLVPHDPLFEHPEAWATPAISANVKVVYFMLIDVLFMIGFLIKIGNLRLKYGFFRGIKLY